MANKIQISAAGALAGAYVGGTSRAVTHAAVSLDSEPLNSGRLKRLPGQALCLPRYSLAEDNITDTPGRTIDCPRCGELIVKHAHVLERVDTETLLDDVANDPDDDEPPVVRHGGAPVEHPIPESLVAHFLDCACGHSAELHFDSGKLGECDKTSCPCKKYRAPIPLPGEAAYELGKAKYGAPNFGEPLQLRPLDKCDMGGPSKVKNRQIESGDSTCEVITKTKRGPVTIGRAWREDGYIVVEFDALPVNGIALIKAIGSQLTEE